jgi:lysyl-tRNA synthetase, class II
MHEENELFAARRQKLETLLQKGVEPFGGSYAITGTIAEIRARFAEGQTERIAGRITAHRDMGKSHFLDLTDATGRFQLFISEKQLTPEQLDIFKLLDLGDFIGAEGECFQTKTGELSLRVHEFTVLTKSLRPIPSNWYGLSDTELRYRQRYLDLLANPESKTIFLKRIAIIRQIRSFFHERGFLEVETPMMQLVPGGAAAEPFKTHHKALGADLYLRIAPELYLKRLLVGGFDKIFELNRNFRNEGISRKHNPEFTMLEAYWAYADSGIMAELLEELICQLSQTICGSLQIEHHDTDGKLIRSINLARPWRRARYHDLIREIDPGWFDFSSEERRARCKQLGVEIQPQMADFEVTQHAFEKLIEERTIDPVFVTHCPKELVPLAKTDRTNPDVVDVFELVINGQEIAPGYSELNDPIVQRERLEHQAGEDKQKIDEDFLLALEHGMPPAGGIGIGIDRLVMLLTGADTIRDVIFFPHLKPKSGP